MNLEKIAFIVDSSFHASDDYLKKNDMYRVYFGISDSLGHQFVDDNSILNTKTILEKFEQGLIFKSNAVIPGHVIALLEDLYKTYDKVICFTISSGLSSYHDNILFLLEEPEYKGKLFIVDTKEVAFSEFRIVDTCRKMLNEGKTIEETLDYAKNAHLSNYTMFTCESWTSLAKSGRIPKMLSLILNKVGTRPTILFYEKNKLGGIVKTFESSVLKIISEFKKIFSYKNPEELLDIVFYNNFLEEDKVKFIKETISFELKIDQDKIVEETVPNLVLIYTAKGSFGLHIRSTKLRK